jgi:glycosyltransferase involved in cell wall biosynthesis
MKVAIIVPGGVDPGREHRVIPCLVWLIERLARVHDVHVFVAGQQPHPARYSLGDAMVHNSRSRLGRVGMLARLLAEHRRGAFDLLHAFWVHPPGVVAAAAARLTGVPMVLHVNGGDLANLPEIDYGLIRSRRGRGWLRWVSGSARIVTTPSLFMRRRARELGIEPRLLHMGVSLDDWPVGPPRERVTGSKPRLLHVASLNRVKDQETLLRALGRIVESGWDATLDVAGVDTLGGHVQRRCRELGLSGRVRFHGFLPHRELRPLVEQSDLLLMTSRHEADPIVLLECAVAGVPAVTTAVGHAADWAPDAARVAGPGDDAGLARQVQILLESEPERLAVARAAQRRALEHDADQTVRRVLELYEVLVRPPDHGMPSSAEPAADRLKRSGTSTGGGGV